MHTKQGQDQALGGQWAALSTSGHRGAPQPSPPCRLSCFPLERCWVEKRKGRKGKSSTRVGSRYLGSSITPRLRSVILGYLTFF